MKWTHLIVQHRNFKATLYMPDYRCWKMPCCACFSATPGDQRQHMGANHPWMAKDHQGRLCMVTLVILDAGTHACCSQRPIQEITVAFKQQSIVQQLVLGLGVFRVEVVFCPDSAAQNQSSARKAPDPKNSRSHVVVSGLNSRLLQSSRHHTVQNGCFPTIY